MPEFCHDESCQTEIDETLEVACSLGWDLVEEFTYCPLHRQEAARRAFATAEMERIRARQAQENRKNAKVTLNAEEYRQWDNFQSDLANFHKKYGKLAPAMLRTMDAKTFIQNVKASGPIDIEEVADRMFEAEKEADKTRAWLMGR